MAKSYDYNTAQIALQYIFRATGGGSVFSGDLHATANFDLFDDSPSVDDAIYFTPGTYSAVMSDLTFNIGTALAGTDVVLKWEYYKRDEGWVELEDLQDDTNSFTITGKNRVRFPLQWRPKNSVVNGYTRQWIRVRLASFTTITEGGANITDTIKTSNGRLTLYGGTDADPFTMEEIYQWFKTNKSYISLTKRNENSYNFTKVGINFNTRTVTHNEVIEFGQDCNDNSQVGMTLLSYIETGIKKDNQNGYGGSTFIVYGRNNSSVIDMNQDGGKFYGATIRTAGTNANNYAYGGYFTFRGEMIDCNVELSTRPPGSDATYVNNVRMVGSLFILSDLKGTFDNIHYLCTGSYFMYVYTNSITLKGFGYAFKNTTGYLFYLYQGSDRGNAEYVLKNPSNPMTLLTDSIKPMRIATRNNKVNIAAVKFYDSSAGTFTDYTSEAQNSTADDVPLGGDVGDYYYFGFTYAGRVYGTSLYFTITNQNNDYEYEWEYWDGSAWQPVEESGRTFIWDGTANLTKTGGFYTATPKSANKGTFDGVNAYWTRMKIVIKGSGIPVATRIQQNRCSGISDWRARSEYTIDLKIIGDNGAIENASVAAFYENGDEIFSVSTDSEGKIVTQYIKNNEVFFDPVNNLSELLGQTIYETFNLIVTKPGYQKMKLTDLATGSPIDWTLKLNRAGIAVDQEVF